MPAGSIIKIEEVTNTSLYTIPPTLSLSRFIYTTKTLNGTIVPASAFVLWPYMTRNFLDSYSTHDSDLPIVAWAHGTSGWSGECGPSHSKCPTVPLIPEYSLIFVFCLVRNLYYQFRIFATATQGYVVIAPDYAGLGLDHDDRGNAIAQQYLANPASGNDVLYSVKAAKQAWKNLGRRYVLMGHSQGGGTAWGAANILAEKGTDGGDVEELRDGYLGTIAAAPHVSFRTTTEIQPNLQRLGLTLGWIAPGMKSIFPSFILGEWLTDKEVRTVELLQDLQGCQSMAKELFTSDDLVKDTWNSSWYGTAFDNLTTVIGRPFAGPLLVIQGSADTSNPAAATLGAVNATCSAISGADIEYVELDGVDHVPLLFASQQVYLVGLKIGSWAGRSEKAVFDGRYHPFAASRLCRRR